MEAQTRSKNFTEMRRKLLRPVSFSSIPEEVALLSAQIEKEISSPEYVSFLDYNRDPSKTLNHSTLLTSYPRSGNTLIRTYIEKITGIFTGSDCDKRRNLNRQLFEMGMKGEGTIDHTVSVIKTHFPERLGN
jgi:hypothetical protein